MWHGLSTLRRIASASPATTDDTRNKSWATVVKSVGVSGLNPKGLLIFVALLPQFTTAHATLPVPARIGVLGLTFVATCAAVYTCIGTFARALLTARPAAARIVSRVSGASMILVGTPRITASRGHEPRGSEASDTPQE